MDTVCLALTVSQLEEVTMAAATTVRPALASSALPAAHARAPLLLRLAPVPLPDFRAVRAVCQTMLLAALMADTVGLAPIVFPLVEENMAAVQMGGLAAAPAPLVPMLPLRLPHRQHHHECRRVPRQ
ncbi:hypothetical protein BAUCODRAFT_342491 [Baudoinia panamericana UAMH 10762]|uniref:Uncharacterized protein n=1 Tax=Baudoinia panamericana (strain UAMH 10762) TaxID=717646 RepID=M2N6B0_BAUPA|nr:uncharacterized protein BAUCODRAFT_342491 [Baudoinia panamericana UAMH 10762]EMC99593.1 hypothetical protein BAUCODRAFT_342491 [Baudoinia panamericana UAMH 10762]